MKIIATMAPDKFMVEMTRQELRQLDEDRSLIIGEEFPIMQAVKTLNALRMLDLDRMLYIGQSIDRLKEAFEEIQNSYNALMLFDRLKNDDLYKQES